MGKIGCVVVMVILIGLAFGCASEQPSTSSAEPITLKALTWTSPQTQTWVKEMVFDEITKRADGELIVEYVGGPEAIPAEDQIPALTSGIADMTKMFSALYQSTVPEVSSLQLSDLAPWEEREAGFTKYMDEIHQKAGLKYLGRGYYGGLAIFTNEPIRNLRTDFQGLKIASSASYQPLWTELGATQITVGFADLYGAMETGLTDAFVFPVSQITKLGFHEVTKYHIPIIFYRSGPGTMVMGLEAWNGLPKHLQDLVVQVQKEYEIAEVDIYEQKVLDETELMKEAGMELITWSEEDVKWFLDLSKQVKWKEVMELCPETGPVIRDMITKK